MARIASDAPATSRMSTSVESRARRPTRSRTAVSRPSSRRCGARPTTSRSPAPGSSNCSGAGSLPRVCREQLRRCASARGVPQRPACSPPGAAARPRGDQVDDGLPGARPAQFPVTGDLADNWELAGPTRSGATWRARPASMRSTALADRCGEPRRGETVDGGHRARHPALRSLLVADRSRRRRWSTVTPDNVLKYLMLDQYRGRTTGSPQSRSAST